MYSVTFYYVPSYNYSHLESALYNSLHRLGWSLFTGWMVLACVTSESGALRNFLASRALVPLSRLTYCAYLTNGFIELYLAASIRTPKFMSVTNLVITKTLINDQNVKLISLFHRSSAKRSPTCVWHFWRRWFYAWCLSRRSTAWRKCCCDEMHRLEVRHQLTATEANPTSLMWAVGVPARLTSQPKFRIVNYF